MSKLVSSIVESMPSKDKPFPKIMRSTVTGDIVLFEYIRNGTILSLGKDNSPGCKIGQQRDDLIMLNFVDIDYPLTITFNMED